MALTGAIVLPADEGDLPGGRSAGSPSLSSAGGRLTRPRSKTPSFPLADPSYATHLAEPERAKLRAALAFVRALLLEGGLSVAEAARRLEALPPPAIVLAEDARKRLCRRRMVCALCGAVIRGPSFYRHRKRCFREHQERAR